MEEDDCAGLRHFPMDKGPAKVCKLTYNCQGTDHRLEGPPASDLEKDEGGWRPCGVGRTDLGSSIRSEST